MTRLLPAFLAVAALLAAGCAKAPTFAAARSHQAPRAHALDPAKFFANAATQGRMPEAFVLTPEGFPAHQAAERIAAPQREALVAAIRADRALAKGVAGFASLDWAARRPILEKIVVLESATFGVKAPPLVIHDEDGRGPAFFEFDVAKPGTGTVHLWPKQLAAEPEPYAALQLTIHETRHSWQFQQAFGPGARKADAALAKGLAAGFRAQTALAGKLSFCDFCTMHHEHEAFRTGNAVVGELTGGKADQSGMGCWTSQVDGQGRPKLDLLALAAEAGPAGLLAAFNEREKGQFAELGGR
jgi:hypothetical protein